MDYRKAASEVIRLIGGKDNIVSAAHCATRLRMVIADNSKVSKEALEEVEGAVSYTHLDVYKRQSQR